MNNFLFFLFFVSIALFSFLRGKKYGEVKSSINYKNVQGTNDMCNNCKPTEYSNEIDKLKILEKTIQDLDFKSYGMSKILKDIALEKDIIEREYFLKLGKEAYEKMKT